MEISQKSTRGGYIATEGENGASEIPTSNSSGKDILVYFPNWKWEKGSLSKVWLYCFLLGMRDWISGCSVIFRLLEYAWYVKVYDTSAASMSVCKGSTDFCLFLIWLWFFRGWTAKLPSLCLLFSFLWLWQWGVSAGQIGFNTLAGQCPHWSQSPSGTMSQQDESFWFSVALTYQRQGWSPGNYTEVGQKKTLF